MLHDLAVFLNVRYFLLLGVFFCKSTGLLKPCAALPPTISTSTGIFQFSQSIW